MIPTEEQILDYFLGKASPEVARGITAWLKDHPERAAELKAWAELETGFAALPLSTPPELVLNRVRNMARESLAPRQAGFYEKLAAAFSFRQLALSFGVVAALALALFVHKTDTQQTRPIAAKTADSASPYAGALRPEAGAEAKTVLTDTTASAADLDFEKAMALFSAGDWENANTGFARVAAAHPDFGRRQELYTYWVETLKKLGKYELAEKKQKLLEQIRAEDAPHAR